MYFQIDTQNRLFITNSINNNLQTFLDNNNIPAKFPDPKWLVKRFGIKKLTNMLFNK